MAFTEQFFAAINMRSGTDKGPKSGNKRPAAKTVITRSYEHPELGNILLAVSRRSKRITLTVKPDCTVRLSVPYGMPVDNGLVFLEKKKEWIVKTLIKYRSRTYSILPPFRTRSHELELVPVDGGHISVRISVGKIRVFYDRAYTPENEQVQAAIKKGLCEAMRVEAKEILPGRINDISVRTGLKYRSVTVRNTVSKWGSCSARNDISLSLHLMRLPDRLIDYILVHELCHTVHKNHGPQFHELLDRLTDGRHKALRNELRGYNTRW